MIKYCWILVGFAVFALGACKNDPASPKEVDENGKLEVGRKTKGKVTAYECTLSNGYLMGVKIGTAVDSLEKRFKRGFTLEKVVQGKETISFYKCVAANGEHVNVFPEMKNGKKLVKRVEYEGSLCRTDLGIGISSRLEDLLKAYPDAKIMRVKDGRVTLAQGMHGWKFVLGTEGVTAKVDLSKLSPDTRVVTIAIE